MGIGSLLVALIVLLKDKEPEYKGKPYSHWVELFANPSHAEAEAAIRAVGTNGLTCLVKWIEYEPSAPDIKLQKAVNKALGYSNWVENRIKRKSNLRDGAIHAFRVLGVEARAAIPLLREMATTSHTPYPAGACLALIGEPAIRAFVSVATNRIVGYRGSLLSAAQLFGTNIWRIVPTLIQCRTETNTQPAIQMVLSIMQQRYQAQFMPALLNSLHSPDAALRIAAEMTLKELSTNAVVSLQACLSDEDPRVRKAAQESLEKIQRRE
jgi:hypothetical protein